VTFVVARPGKVPPEVAESMRREFREIIRSIMPRFPFFALLLRRMRVVASYGADTAFVTPAGVIVVNPDYYRRLSVRHRISLYLHELMHVASLDFLRSRGRHRGKWNVAADCCINEVLRECGADIPHGWVGAHTVASLIKTTGRDVSPEDVRKMSREEIYSLLPDISGPGPGPGPGPGGEGKDMPIPDLPDDESPQSPEGEVINEGDDVFRNPMNSEELEREIRKMVREAYIASKTAGTLPAALESEINRMLEARVDWRTLLKRIFREWMGTKFRQTWKRPSRKHNSFPGSKKYGVSTVWVLMDTSGSIGQRELEQFLGEIYAIASHVSNIVLYCWDAQAYPPQEIRRRADVRRVKVTGGGGTVIRPVLEKVLPRVRHGDAVVILTDGFIYDVNDETTARKLNELARKVTLPVYCYTGQRLPANISGWVQVRIDFDGNSGSV